MSAGLTEEQKLIRDSVTRFVTDEYEFNTRRKVVSKEPGFDAGHWRKFADLGWLALPLPEEHGGLGGTLVDVSIVVEGLARGLFVSPYLSSIVLAAGLVARAGSDRQRQALLTPVVAGEQHLAFAFAEPQARYNLSDVTVEARAQGSEHRLSGAKSVVLFADIATHLLVTARTSGDRRSSEGVSLFIVAAHAPGIDRRSYVTVDAQRASELWLDNVPAELLGPLDGAMPFVDEICDIGCLLLCAEAVGCMGALYEATLSYIKQREQFGASIGSFQAIQHRMVDVFMSYELARSLAYASAQRVDEGVEARELARLASATKFEIAKAGRHIGQESVQLHGGMGMTDELSVGHYFKRLTAINATLGDRHHHLERFRRLDTD